MSTRVAGKSQTPYVGWPRSPQPAESCRGPAPRPLDHPQVVFPVAGLPPLRSLSGYKVGGARLPHATVIASFAADARTTTK